MVCSSCSIVSHSFLANCGKNASACSGVLSISVRQSMSAMGNAVLYSISPPMMYTTSSFVQFASASSSEQNVSHPGNSFSFRDNTMLRRLGSAPLGSERNVLLPIIIVCPVVSSLNLFKSFGNQ